MNTMRLLAFICFTCSAHSVHGRKKLDFFFKFIKCNTIKSDLTFKRTKQSWRHPPPSHVFVFFTPAGITRLFCLGYRRDNSAGVLNYDRRLDSFIDNHPPPCVCITQLGTFNRLPSILFQPTL